MIKRKNIIFISLFFLLNVFLMIVFQYKDKQTYIQELSNQFYTGNGIELVDSNVEKYLNYLNNEKENEYRIFIEIDDIFRIFKSNDEKWKPPIVAGEFFSSEKGQKEAIVGRDLIDIIQEISGEKFINFNNEYYKVTGIMGESFPTKIDSLILLNTDRIELSSDFKIVIDSDNKLFLKKIKNGISSMNPSNLIEIQDLGLNKLVKTDFFSRFFIVNSILISIFSILVYIRYWFEKETKFIYILHLLGFRKNKISTIYMRNIILNLIISDIFSIFMIYIFIFNIHIQSIIKSIFITNITTIFIAFIMYIVSKKNTSTKNLIRRS